MTAGPVTEVLPFSETQYLLRLQALSPAPRGQKGYDKAETDKLVKALIAEVLAAQERAALEHSRAEAAAEAVKYHADANAAQVILAIATGRIAISRPPPTSRPGSGHRDAA